MLMTTNQKLKSPEEPRPFGPGLITFLYIVLLTIMVFLLARSMLRHRFFSGGHPSIRSTAH
jgi:hypothetical protein